MRFIIKYSQTELLINTIKDSQQTMLQNWWPQQEILGAFKTTQYIIPIINILYFQITLMLNCL